MIAERAGVDLAEAAFRLRRYARNRNLRLSDVAKTVVRHPRWGGPLARD